MYKNYNTQTNNKRVAITVICAFLALTLYLNVDMTDAKFSGIIENNVWYNKLSPKHANDLKNIVLSSILNKTTKLIFV